jgi:hypothetical protein
VAPLEFALEKSCSEKGIEMKSHYFLFKEIALPPNITASQFGLKHESVVHPLEDKTSTEPFSWSVIHAHGSPAVFNVTRGNEFTALKSCSSDGIESCARQVYVQY